jgi:hypothetical protein
MYNSNTNHDTMMRELQMAWHCPSTPPSNFELSAPPQQQTVDSVVDGHNAYHRDTQGCAHPGRW